MLLFHCDRHTHKNTSQMRIKLSSTLINIIAFINPPIFIKN